MVRIIGHDHDHSVPRRVMYYQATVTFHDGTQLVTHAQGGTVEQAKRRVRIYLENMGYRQAKKIRLKVWGDSV